MSRGSEEATGSEVEAFGLMVMLGTPWTTSRVFDGLQSIDLQRHGSMQRHVLSQEMLVHCGILQRHHRSYLSIHDLSLSLLTIIHSRSHSFTASPYTRIVCISLVWSGPYAWGRICLIVGNIWCVGAGEPSSRPVRGANSGHSISP